MKKKAAAYSSKLAKKLTQKLGSAIPPKTKPAPNNYGGTN